MKKTNYINWRLLVVCLCLSLSILAVASKIISVQVFDSNFLQYEGKKRYIKYKDTNPVRGTIFDRNNFPLAVSVVNYDLYALGGLNLDRYLKLKDLIAIADTKLEDSSFIKKTLLKKNLTIREQAIINRLDFNRLEIEVRHSRHYPLGDQIAPLIGFHGKDRALEGIEKSYDSVLSGTPGKQKYYTNAKQITISKPIEVERTFSGKDIKLTIDSTIQFYAYKHLVEAIKDNSAKSGTVLVFDNTSGEILAIASYPSYNPNSPDRKIQMNRALVDSYEMGSVLKPIVFSSATDKGIINPDSLMDIPRRLNIGNKIITDTKSYEKLTPKEVIAFSSQVGASKVAMMLGYKSLKQTYLDFGFSRPISVNFSSSAFGFLKIQENISEIEIASMGYGYGFEVSPFQITSAYSVFANKGIFKDFKLILSDEVPEKRLISEESARHTLEALQKVVKIGTGKAAKVKGFNIGGKTGTVHKSIGGGYQEDKYRATFVGIVPIENNSLTIFVSINEPSLNKYSGGAVAAPLFSLIAESSINHLGYFGNE